MGATCCRPRFVFFPNDKIPGQDAAAAEVFQKLLIKEEFLNVFYTAFVDMDADFCGFVRVDELREYFGIPNTAINDKILGMFRSYQRGHLNFMEFVCTIWNFLSKDKAAFPSFAFSSYCDSETQTLDGTQFERLIAAIHGENYKQKGSPALLQIVDKTMRKLTKKQPPTPLTIEDFNNLVRSNPILIGPMLKLRYNMCNELIGEGYWTYLSRKRAEDEEKVDNNYVLKISGHQVSEKCEKEDAIARSVGKPKKRRKSVVDTMKDVLRGNSVIEPAETPSLVVPVNKRKRKSVFKPNLTVRGGEFGA